MSFLRSISLRLLAGFVVVMAFAATVLLTNLQNIFRGETLRRATLYHEELVNAESLRIGNAIYEGGLLAITLAQQADLRNLLIDPGGPAGLVLEQRLREFLDRNRGFSGIALIGADYRVLTNLTRDDRSGVQAGYWEAFFRSGLDPFNAMAKIPVFIDPVPAREGDHSGRIRYTIPLFDEDNTTLGILALDYEIKALIQNLDISAYSYPYFILDDRGFVLAGQDPTGHFNGEVAATIAGWTEANQRALTRTRKGHFIESSPVGEQLVVFSRLISREQTGLHVTLAQVIPMSSIYEPVRLVSEAIAVSIIVTFLLAFLLLAAYSHRLVAPLRYLSKLMDHYQPANPVALPGHVLHRGDEIGNLCQSFQRMSRELESAFRERDERFAQLQENIRLLEQKTNEARELANAKSDFLAIMSHEIRTPINAIVGFSQLLQEETEPEEISYATARILSNSRRLLQLIDNILDFTRIQSGRAVLRAEPFSPAAELQTVEEVFSSTSALKPVTFSVRFAGDPEQQLLGDVVRLRQIISNLVGNALKFTERGRVVLSAQLATEPDSNGKLWLTIQVEDTGIGIPPEKQEVIFRPFEQCDSSLHRRYEGTGLGLAICHRLVELFGGNLHLSSEPGSGSVFTVRLPFEPAPADPVPSGDRQAAHGTFSLQGLRFLIVEDDAVNAEVLAKHLQRHRADQIEFASDADELSQALVAHSYDLIFMDLHLGAEDGCQLTRLIRTGQIGGPSARETPIVVFTAFTEPHLRDAALAAGAQRFFTKPASFPDLMLAIRELLNPVAK